MSIRYVFHDRVDKVEQRRHVGRTLKRGDDIIEENVTTDWVVVVGHMAFDFGPDKPEFEVGDYIKWSLEKVEDVHQ